MLLVEKVPVEPETMILVIRVRIVDPPERLELLETGLVHDLIVPDDLDGHLLVTPYAVPGPHHVGEDPLAGVAVHSVPGVQDLSYPHPVVTLGVIPVVSQVGILLVLKSEILLLVHLKMKALLEG